MRSGEFCRMLLALSLSLLLVVGACAKEEKSSCGLNRTYGCKVIGASCSCGMGCQSDNPYKTIKDCMVAFRDENKNACSTSPCEHGTCLQVIQDPGFSCRCEGTGFYGFRCDKACPSVPVQGMMFPYECIVI